MQNAENVYMSFIFSCLMLSYVTHLNPFNNVSLET